MTITHDTTRETLANIHELLPALEGALAPTNQRALRTQRGVIAWRNSLVQALLLSGNSEAHIARVMSLTRERVRQIKNSFPVGVRTQIQTVQQSITDQRKSYKQHRAYWDTISNHVDSTQLNGKTRPEYMAFRNMLARCYNVNHPQYPDYGGRGVVVTPEWNPAIAGRRAFTNFLNAVGPRPGDRRNNGHALYSIHRIDNALIYSPKTVKWATQKEQCAEGQRRRRGGR